jgi:hypothetical protein
MATWYDDTAGKPSQNPLGGQLSAEQVQLKRVNPFGVDIMGIFNQAFEKVKAQPAEAIGYPLVIMAIQMAVHMAINIIMQFAMFFVAFAGAAASKAHEMLGMAVMIGAGVIIFAVVFVLMMAMQALVQGALNIAWLRLARGQSLKLEHLFEVKRFAKPLIVGSILLPLGVTLGYIFLIIPGIIFMLGCFLYSFVVVDKNLSGVESLKAAWALTDGHKLDLFLLMLLMSLVNMLGMMACGVGMIVTIPMTFGAIAYFYDSIAEPGNAYLQDGEGLDDVFA